MTFFSCLSRKGYGKGWTWRLRDAERSDIRSAVPISLGRMVDGFLIKYSCLPPVPIAGAMLDAIMEILLNRELE